MHQMKEHDFNKVISNLNKSIEYSIDKNQIEILKKTIDLLEASNISKIQIEGIELIQNSLNEITMTLHKIESVIGLLVNQDKSLKISTYPRPQIPPTTIISNTITS